MKVLVDTCVWSEALRRQRRSTGSGTVAAELRRLCEEGLVVLIGPIRQELLSGIRHEQQFIELRDRLRAYPDLPLGTPVFETAAMFSNQCRQRGIQGSQTDFLVCSVAQLHNLSIFTSDRDFEAYHEVLGVTLHPVP